MTDHPSEEEILAKVAEAIAEHKSIDASDVSMDSTFESLDMDSLDAFEMIFELEETFDVDIPNEPARAMRNVKDVVEGLGKLIRGEELVVPEASEDAAVDAPKPDAAQG